MQLYSRQAGTGAPQLTQQLSQPTLAVLPLGSVVAQLRGVLALLTAQGLGVCAAVAPLALQVIEVPGQVRHHHVAIAGHYPVLSRV